MHNDKTHRYQYNGIIRTAKLKCTYMYTSRWRCNQYRFSKHIIIIIIVIVIVVVIIVSLLLFFIFF